MPITANYSHRLAAKITRTASKQAYYTFRFLADRELLPDAYRAYAYFRWVDDCVDATQDSKSERTAFIERQQALLEACYRGEKPAGLQAEEQMLVDLVGNDRQPDSGLQTYLRNMMAVMSFDVKRRGRLISQAELAEYTRLLATAVTEFMHYFIGHGCPTPQGATRNMAVRGAHVVHMLRDALEDVEAGYFNIPSEYLEAHDISIHEVNSEAYRRWVRERVELAHSYFKQGREHLNQVKTLRCRLAGYVYTARFEWVLRAIAKDGYRLRETYPERKSLPAGLWMLWRTLTSLLGVDGSSSEGSKAAILRGEARADEI